jgi:hypothetical protein
MAIFTTVKAGYWWNNRKNYIQKQHSTTPATTTTETGDETWGEHSFLLVHKAAFWKGHTLQKRGVVPLPNRIGGMMLPSCRSKTLNCKRYRPNRDKWLVRKPFRTGNTLFHLSSCNSDANTFANEISFSQLVPNHIRGILLPSHRPKTLNCKRYRPNSDKWLVRKPLLILLLSSSSSHHPPLIILLSARRSEYGWS